MADSHYSRLNTDHSQSRDEQHSINHTNSESDPAADVLLSAAEQNVSKSTNKKFSGWRFGAIVSATTATVIFLINAALLLGLHIAYPSTDGVGTLFTGNCDTNNNVALGLHLAINVASTLLLAASSYCMQCLAAPTRHDCDKAHSRHDWLDIGVNSVRNVMKLGNVRAILWTMLAISSLPIHLFYNSVVFKVLAANEYRFAVVNAAFVNSQTGDTSLWIPRNTYFSSSSLDCTVLQDASVWTIGGWGYELSSDEYLQRLAEQCSLLDCKLKDETILPKVDNGFSINELLHYCLGRDDCAEVYSNGSSRILRLPETEATNSEISSSCHLANCPLPLPNITNPTFMEVLDTCNRPLQYLDNLTSFGVTPIPNRTQAVTSRRKLLDNPASFKEISVQECITSYGQDFVSGWNDVYLVNDDTSTIPKIYAYSDPLSKWYRTWQTQPNQTTYSWLCDSHVEDDGCDIQDLLDQNELRIRVWNDSYVPKSTWNVPSRPFSTLQRINHCVAESSPPMCKTQYSTPLLGIVIACNALKAICMFLAIYYQRQAPLVVVGDAIASYLHRSDVATRFQCLATNKMARRRLKARILPAKMALSSQETQTRRLYNAATAGQWIGSLIPVFILVPATMLLLVKATSSATFYMNGKNPWTLGLGVARLKLTLPRFTGDQSYMALVLISNLPQLLVSLTYIAYNNLLTSMLLHSEWSEYAVEPKALRVTTPTGEQRSTYFLHLPYKYGIPMLAASALLHWMISQAFFLLQVVVYDESKEDYASDISAIGYSPSAILLSLLIGISMVALIAGVAIRRAYSNMPIAGSNSFAISAACHPPQEDLDAAVCLVQWGETRKSRSRDIGHCTFTSMPVIALKAGRIYE